MHLFSNNIVFVDTEFSDLNPYVGEILSIAMVKPSGEELYLELEHEGEVSDWVREHVLPRLTQEKVSREEAKRLIREFVGGERPYMIALVPQYDMIYLAKLFGWDALPVYWFPVDFATMMFVRGHNPEDYLERNDHQFIREIGIDMEGVHVHHALDDARLLKKVFEKFVTVK